MMVRVYWPQPCAVCCPYAALTPSNGVKCDARADGDGPAVFFSARAALTALCAHGLRLRAACLSDA